MPRSITGQVAALVDKRDTNVVSKDQVAAVGRRPTDRFSWLTEVSS